MVDISTVNGIINQLITWRAPLCRGSHCHVTAGCTNLTPIRDGLWKRPCPAPTNWLVKQKTPCRQIQYIQFINPKHERSQTAFRLFSYVTVLFLYNSEFQTPLQHVPQNDPKWNYEYFVVIFLLPRMTLMQQFALDNCTFSSMIMMIYLLKVAIFRGNVSNSGQS